MATNASILAAFERMWQHIVTKISTKADINHTHNIATVDSYGLMAASDKVKVDYTNMAYGTCSTAADVAAKSVTITGNTEWSLKVGSIITVKFSATNSLKCFNANFCSIPLLNNVHLESAVPTEK